MKNTKPRGNKSRTSTETVSPTKLSPPFRVINGEIVHATHDGKKWVWDESN